MGRRLQPSESGDAPGTPASSTIRPAGPGEPPPEGGWSGRRLGGATGAASDANWMEVARAQVGLDARDVDILRAMLTRVEPHLDAVAERTTETLAALSEAEGGGAPRETRGPIQQALRQWAHDLLAGPHDGSHLEGRRRLLELLESLDVPSRFVMPAMSRLRRELLAAYEHERGAPTPADERDALLKAAELDELLLAQPGAAPDPEREEALLRDLVVSNLPIEALLLDVRGRVTAATEPLRRRLTHASRDGVRPIRGRLYDRVLPGELVTEAALEERFAQALRTGQEIVVPRVEVRDGHRVVSYTVRVVPIRVERSHLLVQLDDRGDVSEDAARDRDRDGPFQPARFAARIAHEIRNPLAGMSGTMQLVLGALPDGDRRRGAIGKALEQVRRLNDLVDALQDFARPVTASCQRLDLRYVAERVASELAMQGFEPPVLHGNGPGRADADLLGAALFELVRNAYQAGAVRVAIELEPAGIRVVDDGPGLEPAEGERVFEPFYTARTRGAGLGLSNARTAVEAMEGRLVVRRSGPGGTSFELRLPRDRTG